MLLSIAAVVGFAAFVWFIVYMGRLLERGAEKRDFFKLLGLSKNSKAQLDSAEKIMRELQFTTNYNDPNILNDETQRKVNVWIRDYKKEIK